MRPESTARAVLDSLPPAARDVLRCPHCGSRLRSEAAAVHCTGCARTYGASAAQVDLRPVERLTRRLDIAVLPPGARSAPPWPRPLAAGPHPPIGYDAADWQMSAGNRLTPELTTYVPPATEPQQVLLDVGCGTGTLGRLLAARRGYSYLGIDYDSPDSAVLGDAEALPVADGSCSVISSFAVLEHVRSPAAVTVESARCLRPGGVLVGSVAFLEPFHLNSYFHHTHLGLHAVLEDAGLDVVAVEANADWVGHSALAEMTEGGRVLRAGLRTAARLSRATGVHRREVAQHPDRLAAKTAGFRFVAVKP